MVQLKGKEISRSVFYELTMRDVRMERVLDGVIGIMAPAAAAWIVLHFFVTPLSNDHVPLLAARQPLKRRSAQLFRRRLGTTSRR